MSAETEGRFQLVCTFLVAGGGGEETCFGSQVCCFMPKFCITGAFSYLQLCRVQHLVSSTSILCVYIL